MSEVKRLVRSERNKVVGGVCGGLGEYLDIDPTIIRLVFVVFTLAGGSGVLVYLILWLVMPPGEPLG
jgi:phage shock protein C